MEPEFRGALSRDALGRLAEQGFAIEPGWLGSQDVRALRERLVELDRRRALAPAGVGRGSARVVERRIRGDRIRWIDAATDNDAEKRLLRAFESLRLALNRELTLGLFELEAHYALYPPGAAYAMHRDRFRDDDARVVSCVLYLNDRWHAGDGGALRLHVAGDRCEDVQPMGGTLVLFFSERMFHAVLPASRSRLSVAGWFRRHA
jgi:SM-20-related protein